MMTTTTRLLVAACLAGLLASEAEGQIDYLYSSCVQIISFGNAFEDPTPTDQCGGGIQAPMITIQGDFSLNTQGLTDRAVVSCWVCEQGTCDPSSVYGPARSLYQLSQQAGEMSGSWEVFFLFHPDAMSGQSPFPTFNSYSCQIELAAENSDFGPPLSPTVPGFFESDLRARAAEGSTLVAQLQGTFTEPVSATKVPKG